MARITKKEEFPNILPCKFAGDPEDAICVDCNGVTMIVEGKKYSCKDCQAYTEPEEQPVAEPEEQKQPDKKKEEQKQPVGETLVESNEEELPEPEVFEVEGITTSIKAESGLSVELKDRKGLSKWYKFSYSEERRVPEGCDIEKEKNALWNDVNRTVDQQLEDTILYIESK